MYYSGLARIAFVFSFFAIRNFAVAQNIDVNGLKLGISLDEAKTLIGTGFTSRVDKFEDPNIALLSAVSAQNPAMDTWVVEAVSGKVVYIQHEHGFAPDNLPAMSSTQGRVKVKYGTPTRENGVTSYVWAYDANGEVFAHSEPWDAKANKQSQICENPKGAMAPVQVGFRGGRQNSYPLQATPICHVTLTAELGFATDQNFVTYTLVTLANHQALLGEYKRWDQVKANAGQQKLDKAKQVQTPF